jgi:hypothetical protein
MNQQSGWGLALAGVALLALAFWFFGNGPDRMRLVELSVDPVFEPRPESRYQIGLRIVNRNAEPIRIVGMPTC